MCDRCERMQTRVQEEDKVVEGERMQTKLDSRM